MKLTPILWRLVRGIALSLLGVVVLLFALQHKLIYFPRTFDFEQAKSRASEEGLEVLEFTTDEGQQLAYYLAPEGTDLDRLWLVFSGNAQIALDWVTFCRRHASAGRGFLLIDYPGYGANQGSPSPSRISTVARGALDAFRAKHGEAPRLAVLGTSLGGATALAAALDLGIERAVVAACFTDMLSMARRAVGWPLNHVLRHRFDNVSSLEQLSLRNARVTLLHGNRDEVIPVEHGRELFRRFPSIIDYVEVDGAGHNDILWFEPESIANALDARF